MKEFFDPIWKECLRVLKPGALAFVMSAPRSDVQTIMSQTLRDAGFDISFTPIYWTYASGFPKAMNIGKMIDKRQGNKREEVEDPQSAKRNKTKSDREVYGDYKDTDYKVTKGSSELEGSYGGFQPKPAVEVVLVAMKPIEEKGLLAQAQKNGKAVSWFDDCRIPFDEGDTPQGGYGAMDIGIGKPGETQDYRSKDYKNYVKKQKSFKGSETIGTTIKGNEHFLGGDIEQLDPSENFVDEKAGRFPANLLVSDNVLDDGTEKKTKVSDYEKYMKDNVAGQMNFDEKYEKNSGKMYEGGWEKPKRKKKKMTMPDLRDVGKKSKEAIGIDKLSYGQVQNAERKEYEMWDIEETTNGYSRFFSLDNWFSKNIKQLPEPVQQTFPFMIVPKASKSEKNDGLDNFDTKQTTGGGGGVGDYIDDVNSASGKFGSEKAPSRNIHPTVKPLTLMNYLVVLGSRKGDVVLEPFAGSGTTALACVSQERDYIAIEREEEYYDIAKARLDKVERPLKMWEKFS
jgi:DNA modification methylase